MLLRFQKAAARGNYETGNQAFSKRLRFLTTRGSATHDVAIEIAKRGRFINHRIDPAVDVERDFVDRDSKFSADVVTTVEDNGTQPVRTTFRSPWQNGVAERWVGSVRRDLLDHVIVLNERHLRRLLKDYVRYYHEDRTHLGLGKDTPVSRVAASVPLRGQKVISLPRLGGLHHRYTVAA